MLLNTVNPGGSACFLQFLLKEADVTLSTAMLPQTQPAHGAVFCIVPPLHSTTALTLYWCGSEGY